MTNPNLSTADATCQCLSDSIMVIELMLSRLNDSTQATNEYRYLDMLPDEAKSALRDEFIDVKLGLEYLRNVHEGGFDVTEHLRAVRRSIVRTRWNSALAVTLAVIDSVLRAQAQSTE